MAEYRCTVCNYLYDEAKSGTSFSELTNDWTCPVCNSPLSMFMLHTNTSEDDPKLEKTVSDVLAEQMVECGIQYVFGLPGTSALGIVEAIRKNKNIKFLQVRHEQTAAFMASAYGKLTGQVAACLTVAGPGATNTATGLYDAKLDHSPVLALTGLVKRQMMGPGSFQEIDQHSFFEPISVFNKILMSQEQTTSLITLAVKHALLERGVSHISIPNDVQKLSYDAPVIPFEKRLPSLAIAPSSELISQAAAVINQALRPVIISGYGALGQGANLLKLAKKITAPIVTTFRGKGVINEDHELYVGGHGTIGSTSASKLVQQSDLLIVIGASFSDMTQIPEKKTIQVDIDPMMIAKKYPVEVGLWGNSSEVLPKLTALVSANINTEYMEQIRSLKKEWLALLDKEADPDASPLRPQYIIKVLNERLPADSVISLDIGENGWWFGRNFWMKESQKMVMSGYLASMGTGLPGAMAAQIAYPGRQVVCITGDGGFSMVMSDFLTVVKNKLPIKIFLFNNHQLGMIMQEQKVENYPHWETDLYNCDFAEYARNCGGVGLRVTEAAELPVAVEKALASNEPVIVDIETDPRRFVPSR
ncbi:MAG: thiamine pyrophosphate-binding protein [Desulfotomaculaceae bacterium]|nr:thiamine pyrophosphate-binding protein [Desulfotomaculaceae bacterium]